MTVTNEQNRRFREKNANFVGGVYGQKRVRLPGYEPQPKLVFFNGATLIKQDDDTAQWGTWPSGTTRSLRQNTVGGDTDNIQVYYRFPKPTNNLKMILLPINRWVMTVEANSGGGNADVTIECRMILVDLFTGTFALETMTWSLGFYKIGSQGTLFQTPANFAETLFVANLQAKNIDAEVNESRYNHGGAVEDNYIGANTGVSLVSGPYTGIHLSLSESARVISEARVEDPATLNGFSILGDLLSSFAAVG